MATGCYTPLYLPASFKGVPFHAMEASSEHGRRGAEGEFPFGENTAYADMGRRLRRYTLQARFQTNLHLVEAAALIAAVESRGPGILVHPTRGPVRVACTSCRVTDNVEEEQGVTYADLEFVEAAEWVNGFNFAGGIAGLAIAGIVTAARVFFGNTYAPRSSSYYQRQPAKQAASSAIMDVRQELQRATVGSTDTRVTSALADLETAARDDGVLRYAERVSETTTLGMAGVSIYTAGQQKYDAFRRIANANADVSRLSGAAADSENAVYALMRIVSAAYMAKATTEYEPDTISAALAEYNTVLDLLTQEADVARAACDNNLYLALRDFIVQVQITMLTRAYNLPAMVVYNFGASVHSLVAAYEIFDDAKRFGEIERRNPGTLPYLVGPEIVAPRT